MTEPFVSYAQHGEDVILWRALGGAEPRFYVDVGAFDPTDDSVTRALYERGWRGINIEPQRDRIALFRRDRPEDINLCVAIGATDGRATLHVPDVPGWATLDDGIASGLRDGGTSVEDRDVEVRTLDSVFREHGIDRVDVLKIDVEGAEPDVVRGLDFARVRPTVVVIEGVAPGVGRAAGDRAVALLADAGYTHCLFDGLNHYLTGDPALAPALSLPANPTDGYVAAPIYLLERAITRFQMERHDLLERIEELAPSSAPPVAEALAAYPASRTAPADVVRRRRHLALQRLLHRPPDPDVLTVAAGPAPTSDAGLLADAITAREPEQIVGAVYRVVLRRDVDPHGLSSWVGVLGQGVSPMEIARLIAESGEARSLGEAHESAVADAIEGASALVLLRELTQPPRMPDGNLRPTPAAHALLVTAVYEVCFGRRPTAEELAGETARLARGSSRDRLIASYARSPEAWRRVMGFAPSGLAGRVQRRLGRRRVTAKVRQRVAAAEIRGIAASGLIAADLQRAAGGGAGRDRADAG